MPNEGDATTFVANCIRFTALYHTTDGNYYPVLVDGTPLTSGRVDGANWSKIKFFITFKRGSSDDAVTWHSASNGGSTGSVGTNTYYVSYYKPGATYPFHLKTGNSTGSTNQGWITEADFKKFCAIKPKILYYKNNSNATGTTGYPLAEDNSNRSATQSSLARYNNSQNLYNVSTLFSLTGHQVPSDAQAWRIGSGSSTVYANQASVNFHSIASAISDYSASGNYIKLYANWERIIYTITYNLNGGTAASTLKTSYSVASDTFTLPQVSKTGYAFTGWTGSNGSTPNKTVTITKGSTTGNKTYTANFSPKAITVRFNKNDGSGDQASQTFTYGVSGNKFGYKTDGTEQWPATEGSYADLYGFGQWYREGYKIIGWAHSSSATTPDYTTYSGVANSWIDEQVGNASAKTINLHAVWDYNGLVRIYTEDGWKMAIPYVYSGGWKQAIPYIYNGGWKQGI